MTTDTGQALPIAPGENEAAKRDGSEDRPHWRLTTERVNRVDTVTFSIDLDPPTPTAHEAMRKLAAVALWWIDTDAGGLWNNLPGTVEQGGRLEPDPIADLIERLERAAKELSALEADQPPDMSLRLQGKRQGVMLALSYAREYQR